MKIFGQSDCYKRNSKTLVHEREILKKEEVLSYINIFTKGRQQKPP